MVQLRKRIVWKKDAATQASESKKLRPVMRVVSRTDEHVFVPGQLFRLNLPLEVIPTHPRDQLPPFPYVGKSWYMAPGPGMHGHIPQGSLAIFVGHTRVEEAEGTQTRSLLRATFLIDGARYMPVDLNYFDFVS